MKPKVGNAVIVVGGKWGDEGKGKITSRFSKDADLVIRGTGGANAGHTIVFKGKKIALHLVPGGIVYPQTTCLIGQGVVIDVPVLLNEIEELKKNRCSQCKRKAQNHRTCPYCFSVS
jgi:adenylosuccinate synthase